MKIQRKAKRAATCLGFAALIFLASCTSTQNSAVAEMHRGDHLTSFSQEIISPVHEFQVKAGGSYMLDIKVKNTGTQPWFGGANAYSVTAGYRWVDDKSNVLPIEGNRALLTRPVVQPGETDQLRLQVAAPPNPGSYTLRVSMVQEGVAWFFNQGAQPLVLRVTVS